MISLKQSYDIEYVNGENASRFDLFIDSASDLNGVTHFDNVKLLQGSSAEDISTGDIYKLTGSGSWILQPSANAWQNVYTKSEIDALITPQSAALAALVAQSAKNRMLLSGSNVTGYGIACTFDAADGTIHLDGINPDKTCTGSFNIQAADSRALGLVEGTVYHFSCDGYATDNNTIGLYVYTSGATPQTQFDCFTNNEAAWNTSWEQASGFRLFIRQGTIVDNVTLRPMIAEKSLYDISPGFAPYTPTLSELYQLVKSYHP